MMTDTNDERSSVDVAEHDGDIRIYEVTNIENWIQSDTSVKDYLDETDADTIAGVLNSIENDMPDDDSVDTVGDGDE